MKASGPIGPQFILTRRCYAATGFIEGFIAALGQWYQGEEIRWQRKAEPESTPVLLFECSLLAIGCVSGLI